MLFDEDFIVEVVADPINGIVKICNKAIKNIDENQMDWYFDDYENLTEALALIEGLVDGGFVDSPIATPFYSGDKQEDCLAIYNYLTNIRNYFSSHASKLRFDFLKNKFKNSIGSGFVFEFSQGDLERVQELVNQLRELISTSDKLDKDHQQRLLKRLEKLQSELHKKVSDLDRFWGLVGDAGVVLGKLGENAKPFVDRVKEIADIVWRTQSRAEELPSGVGIPLLAKNKDEQ